MFYHKVQLITFTRLAIPKLSVSLPPSVFTHKKISFRSILLQRQVGLNLLFLPDKSGGYDHSNFLFLNDGQELARLHYLSTLEKLAVKFSPFPLVTIAITAGDRIQEYGVAGMTDYKGRGSKAALYHRFLIEELFPYVEQYFEIPLKPANTGILGCSLGGLSAFDFAWEHPDYVSRVGVCSGSFWWRTKALGPDYRDSDRIMHQKVLNTRGAPAIKCWFQAGTLDESSDRNHNGLIDSIEDTLDLAFLLERKGFIWDQTLCYVQVEGGEHHPSTWSGVIAQFLQWAF